MVIHCISCGKSISSYLHHCPYCLSEVNEIMLEVNGIEEKGKLKEKMRELVFGFVHR